MTAFRCGGARLVLAMLTGLLLCGSAKSAWAQPEDDGRLTAVGGLSAGYMYTSYVAIGSIADAFGGDVYEPKQVQDLMEGMVGMMDNIKKQVLKVQEHCDDEEDKQYLEDTLDVFTLLQEEARQLSKFSASRDVADYRAYERARTKAWAKIQKLLGLK